MLNNNNLCGCSIQSGCMADARCTCMRGFPEPLPSEWAYAMAYVPFQQEYEPYTCEKALARGTLFPCLDKPFMMGCCK